MLRSVTAALAVLALVASGVPHKAGVTTATATPAASLWAAHPVLASGPCQARDAVWLQPGDNPHPAILAAGPHGSLCFAHGIYRLRAALRPMAGQALIGHRSVLSGSRILHNFRRTTDGWSISGQTQQGERNGECAGRGRACTYPDDVLRDGHRLRRVMRRHALVAGTFFFDYPHDTIDVGDDPRGHVLEAMVASTAILSRQGAAGAGVTVRGFLVEHVASRAQHGAIETTAPGWTIANNTVRVNHGAGITSNGHVRINGNKVLRNGQLGIGGTGDATFVVDNEIAYNNTAGFDPGWEAGGAKWALTDHLVVRANDVHDNLGPGLWTDIDAQHTTYVRNVVRDNAWMGIFHEISAQAVIRDNIVTGNGTGFSIWLWGSGILLAGSHDVEVADNKLAGNAEGIGLIQQARGRSELDGTPRRLHDIAIHDNRTWMNASESGAVEDSGYRRLFTDSTITWSHNHWHQSRGDVFMWKDRYLSARQWRHAGNDVDGTFD